MALALLQLGPHTDKQTYSTTYLALSFVALMKRKKLRKNKPEYKKGQPYLFYIHICIMYVSDDCIKFHRTLKRNHIIVIYYVEKIKRGKIK